ncbi:hypothetical protein BZA05DRAFT_392924 [Tricharina praecox]|uniref:uncharacterized protein n=1 Tax=Tricharina praecox TaxID=43433 RepID=UPI00221E8284|nr:uncharacterized protein BZA05DRAFT_392924 [Tricharina praecox]KAI5854909.1 hypothetical protein BZA05DRAFT_392924 [Tricharina praecox]
MVRVLLLLRRRKACWSISRCCVTNHLIWLNLRPEPILAASVRVEVTHLVSHVVGYIGLPFHGHLRSHDASSRSC